MLSQVLQKVNDFHFEHGGNISLNVDYDDMTMIIVIALGFWHCVSDASPRLSCLVKLSFGWSYCLCFSL